MNKRMAENLIRFMDRVPVTGLESVAWCEAYNFLQQELAKPIDPPPVAGVAESPPNLELLP